MVLNPNTDRWLLQLKCDCTYNKKVQWESNVECCARRAWRCDPAGVPDVRVYLDPGGLPAGGRAAHLVSGQAQQHQADQVRFCPSHRVRYLLDPEIPPVLSSCPGNPFTHSLGHPRYHDLRRPM
jgi:hypothetical protein